MRLELSEVTKSFGSHDVLNRVSLVAETGSLAIIGPSGGGKSTLLRVVAGLIPPDGGQVLFDGEPVNYHQSVELKKHIRRIGFVFQSKGLFEHLTSLDNIILPLIHVHRVPPGEAKERARSLLDQFGLSSQEDKRPHQMSGGQQQRVAIARAVATEPEWLVLDEPTSALDPEYTADVLEMLGQVQSQGIRIIVVTHHMGFARHSCEQVAFLSGGQVVETGPAAQVFGSGANPEVKRFLDHILAWDT